MRSTVFLPAVALAVAAVVVTPVTANALQFDVSTCGRTYIWGRPTDIAVKGDWGASTIDDNDDVGLVRDGTWYLGNQSCLPRTFATFTFGRAGDDPLVGDWEGDTIDSPGVRRGNVFYLRNEVTTGPVSRQFSFGRSTDRVVTGDWDGDGRDGVGVQRGNTFYLREPGGAIQTFVLGRATDVPLAGDWDGDGVDTIGVRRGPTWYLTDDNRTVTRVLGYGLGDTDPLPGDWRGTEVRHQDLPAVTR